jgi:outer membrane protein OmpA-like peptidoglycan-associated protein
MMMIQPRTRIATALLTVGIVSCSSAPPKAPEVDESGKRPANSKSAVELQVCRGELADSRLEVSEARKLAEGASAALAQVTVEQFKNLAGLPIPIQAAASPARGSHGNVVWTLRFAFNSSRVDATAEELQRVIDAAKSAAYVVVKGRTDGAVETPGESTIALRRMAAMYDVLLKGGVDPHKIAVQYQPVGDRIADNTSEEGRSANRRAEVELYPVPPERLAVHGGPAVAAVKAM